MLCAMNFSFVENRTIVSIVKTQNKPRCSATNLEQWKHPSGTDKEWNRSNQNLSLCLATCQYSANISATWLLVGVLYFLSKSFLKSENIFKFKHTGHTLLFLSRSRFDFKGWALLALKEKYLGIADIQIILQKYTCQIRATTFWSYA
jgi:hypothetical protein